MKTKTTWLLALTLSEWLNWVAAGRLRLNNRVIQMAGRNDLEGFAAVMHHAPDVSFLDDGAFILAELKPNWSEYQEAMRYTRASSVMWLQLESVKEFLPLSERGARLLESDAHRAHVALGQPQFEETWDAWRADEIKNRAEWRSEAFVRALDLMAPKINSLPNKVRSFLLGDIPLPNAGKTSKLESTRALAWANAFAVFGELAGPEEKAIQTEALGLKTLIGKLQIDYNINCPILFESPDLHIADKLSQVIKDRLGFSLSVHLLVLVFHYLGIIDAEKDISLNALIDDLAVLREKSGPESVANATYLIGHKMTDISVTTLLYNRFSELFPSLVPQELPISVSIINDAKKSKNHETNLQQENSCHGEQAKLEATSGRDPNPMPDKTSRQDNEIEHVDTQADCKENTDAPEDDSTETASEIEARPSKKNITRKGKNRK